MKKQPTARRITRLMKEGNYRQAAQELYGFCAAENKVRILMPKDAVAMLDEDRTAEQERFVVLTLDGAHEVIKRHVVSQGLVNKTIVHPREVFRTAIADNAVAIIIGHNHPSGNIEPSHEDIDITKRLRSAGDIVGIPVLDHIVVGGSEYYSFVEHGLISSKM